MDGCLPSTHHPFPTGAAFRWHGDPIDLAGGQALVLDDPAGDAPLRYRMRTTIDKLRSVRGDGPRSGVTPSDREGRLVLGLGERNWTASVLRAPGGDLVLAFDGPLPPARTDLRILAQPAVVRARAGRGGSGTLCFTPGTLIDTPAGPRAVETLTPGDAVATRDDGAATLMWMGHRALTARDLDVRPGLRPIRLRAGSLAPGRPHPDLVVSPDHRVLLAGDAARALWGEAEVLVRAADLLDDGSVTREHGRASVGYVHLLFARHQIVRANGVWVESFHPGDADLSHLTTAALAALCDVAPDPDFDGYGPHARRCLSVADLAMMRHEGAPRHLA